MASSIPTPANLFQGLSKRWHIAAPLTGDQLSPLGELPSLIAELLHRRGVRTASEATAFLEVSDSLLEDPNTLPGIAPAVERLQSARDRGETVAVYGDFDSDGVTGTALMVRALGRFGIASVPYIPHRVQEGHGLNAPAINLLHSQGVSLIVTVDCGVNDVEAVALASELGMETIITDHHTIGGPLPGAVAIINPKALDSTYPFYDLTGVGMALKLAHALLEPGLPDTWAEGLLELAAIGTVTDMAPLLHENRYIVRRGVEQLRHTTTPGLLELMRAARLEPLLLEAEGIGFGIGPRLNAAGRLDHAMAAYDLLMTTDSAHAKALTAQLETHNNQRRELTDEVLRRCRAQVLEAEDIGPLIMVGSPDYNPGVVGLVAGKLTEELGVPTAVYSVDRNVVRASCRSAPSFHWAEALEACEPLLTRYGGHAQAAGFTCDAAVLPELQERLAAIASEQLDGQPRTTDGFVDAALPLQHLMGPIFTACRSLAPFGVGNPAPVFLTRGLEVESVRTMGADKAHFRMRLRSNAAVWEAVAFRQSFVAGTKRVDVVYTLDIDHWGGTSKLRLTVLDYAPAA
jgi:single-stranded-DNA-specific exonuclease